MSLTITPPQPSEYAAYYSDDIAALPKGDILEILESQRVQVARALEQVASDDWSTFRYEPGKWCVADIIGHISDAERIFSTRALRISRGDNTPLPGWDQDQYVFVAGAEGREIEDLAEEFDLVRRSTIAMIKSWEPEALDRKGVANNYDVTVRALVYIMAGHVQHHTEVLRRLYRVKI